MTKTVIKIKIIPPTPWLTQLALLLVRKTVVQEVVVDEPNYRQSNVTEYKLYKGKRYNERSYGITSIGPLNYTFEAEKA